MTKEKAEAVIEALDRNDWARITQIAGRDCKLSVIRAAQAFIAA